MHIHCSLETLKDKHFEIHKLIEFAQSHNADDAEIHKLKKEKLLLKDQIIALESQKEKSE